MKEIDKPRLGVSACLLGHPVRFDGGHKRQAFITENLSRHFTLQPVCPEVEVGFGVPRPTIQLRRLPGQTETSLVNPRQPDIDLTTAMRGFAELRVAALGELCGFIFKKDSPSCGMERVPVVIGHNGERQRTGTGLFAQAFIQRWPLIPTEEEGRLNDPGLRESFFERVYALQRWRAIEDPDRNVQGLIRFHTEHKLLIMARNASYYQELGRLVAGTTRNTLKTVREAYIARFMQVLAMPTSRGRQVNVLQHLLGYFKRDLDNADKQELLHLFECYRRQEIPLITPLTLLRHHLRRIPNDYLATQHYLNPYPESLALRSHT